MNNLIRFLVSAIVPGSLVPVGFWLSNDIFMEHTRVTELIFLLVAGILVALAHVVFLALPISLLIDDGKLQSLKWCLFGGVLVAIAPTALFNFYGATIGNSDYFAYWSNGELRELFVDGKTTVAFWVDFLINVLKIGVFGGIGGFTFWQFSRFRKVSAPHQQF